MKSYKICILTHSLGGGGAERAAVMQAQMFKELGYEVHFVTDVSRLDYDVEARVFNSSDVAKGVFKKIRRLLFYLKIFEKEKYDFVIENRVRNKTIKELFYYCIVFRKFKMINIVHNARIELYFQKNRYISDFLNTKAKKLVTVSKFIEGRVKEDLKFENVECIYNAFDPIKIKELSEKENLDIDYQYVIVYGRLVDESKNYMFLFNCYKESLLPIKNIKLLVVGDGPDKSLLINKCKSLGLEDYIVFKDFTPNPFPYVKNALFSTLTSNYEGFPMVLIESLAIGTPVVSVNCPSGPSEIIETGKNGVLVPFKSKIDFVSAMNKMVSDKKFYLSCKEGTIESTKVFHESKIRVKWEKLFLSIDNRRK